jgi:hypothetical protein
MVEIIPPDFEIQSSPYTEKNDDYIGYGSNIINMTIHPILTSLASVCSFLNCSESIVLTLNEVGTPPVLSTSLSQSITSDQSFIISSNLRCSVPFCISFTEYEALNLLASQAEVAHEQKS